MKVEADDVVYELEKDAAIDRLQEEFCEFAAAYPNTALSIITGFFVGLLVHMVLDKGGDPNKEISVESDGQRTITLSAVTAE